MFGTTFRGSEGTEVPTPVSGFPFTSVESEPDSSLDMVSLISSTLIFFLFGRVTTSTSEASASISAIGRIRLPDPGA